MWRTFLPIILGGAIGASCRYLVGKWVHAAVDTDYPWGTTVVNLLGAFLFGVLWAVLEARFPTQSAWRLFLLTGLLGAFTTFSTLAFESAQLLSQARFGAAAMNLALQNLLGVVAIFAGLALAQRWGGG